MYQGKHPASQISSIINVLFSLTDEYHPVDPKNAASSASAQLNNVITSFTRYLFPPLFQASKRSKLEHQNYRTIYHHAGGPLSYSRFFTTTSHGRIVLAVDAKNTVLLYTKITIPPTTTWAGSYCTCGFPTPSTTGISYSCGFFYPVLSSF